MKISNTAVCRLVNRCFPRAAAPALGRRQDQTAYARWEFDHAADSLRRFEPHGDIRGKQLLDMGCGLGGKTTWYALNGAETVTAVDLDPERVEYAARFARQMGAENTTFLAGDAAGLKELDQGRFDMVLFNDAFEHLDQPAEALARCRLLLATGGTAHIVFPPWGSPWGAHLFAYIGIPWAQLLFTDRPLLEIWKERFRAEGGDGRGLITPKKLAEVKAAETVAQLRQLNRMTIRRFRRLVEASSLTPLMIREETPRWIFPRPKRNLRLREHLVTRVTAVLEKRG